MILGAADQSADVCELQKPVDTAAHHWARGQGRGQICLQCLSHTLRAAEPTTRRTNKPFSALGALSFRQQKFNMRKSKLVLSCGPLEFVNYRPESWPDPFTVTTEFCSQLMSYCRQNYPSAKLLLVFKNTQNPLR